MLLDYRYDTIATEAREYAFSAIALGDSIVQMWPLSLLEGAVGGNVLNAGVNGATTQSLNLMLGQTDWFRQNPNRIVLLIGTNNMRQSPPCDIYWGVRSNVTAIHKLFRRAAVSVFSVLPRGINMAEYDVEIRTVNTALGEGAIAGAYTFVDTHDAFLCGNKTPCSLMKPDPAWIHPSREGYDILTKALSK